MAALRAQRLCRGLCQSGVGFQVFMEHLHLPPFFVARGNGLVVARDVAAYQMQDACTAVLVREDLANQTGLFPIPLQPALQGTVFWQTPARLPPRNACCACRLRSPPRVGCP